jgi:hypothetical protein
MKTLIYNSRHGGDNLLLLLFFCLVASEIAAQASPQPMITDYDATSLPTQYQINADTTFCKAQTITIHGRNFKKATGAETWSATWVVFGTVSGIAANVLSVTSQSGGMDDRIVCEIPPFYTRDTCLRVRIIKRTVQFPADTFVYYGTDTVCLTGDRAIVSYAAPVFCLGDSNPLPQQITLAPPTATGGFCCATGAPGFWVNPATGELPLHPGAVGPSNQFLYCTNHPRCPDTVVIAVAIEPRQASMAVIQGQTFFTVCQSSPTVLPDTANLYPTGGEFHSWTGLVVTDIQTGEFAPILSPVGLHSLWYVPYTPCFDSVEIQVVVMPVATAVLGYPAIPLNMGLPTVCQGTASVWPSFVSGNAGGVFQSAPSGLDLGGLGDIDPGNSIAGVYTVQYATTGLCPDTVLVVANLHVDTTISAQFTLGQTQYCADGVLSPVAQSASGLWEVTSTTGQVLYSQGTAPIAIAATGIASGVNYILRHVTGGYCADTATVSFSVLATDNPTFTYPPSGVFCLGDADPWPLVTGAGGGTFRAVTPVTVVDLDGRLRLAASGAGTHVIRYVTGGFCKDSLDVSVSIFGTASANFAYAGSVFCSGDTNPLPVVLGTPGGFFTGDVGLVVDSVSGGIGLDLSLPGTWNVTYTLAGSCQAQFTQTVQISATDSATFFAYVPDHYCQADLDPVPMVVGDTIGSFVAGGGIVFSNTDLGALDLSAMQAGGPYIVYYDIDNRCAVDVRDSVWIDLPDDPTFAYPQSSYCEGGLNPLPSSIAMQGGTFSEITGSVVFTDEIDADASFSGGPYFITYTTAGACPESQAVQLSLLPKPQSPLLTVNPDTVYCREHAVDLAVQQGIAPSITWLLNGDSIGARPDDPLLFLGGLLKDRDTVAVVLGNLQGCTDTTVLHLQAVPSPHLRLRRIDAGTNALGSATVRFALDTDMPGTVVEWFAHGDGLHDISPKEGTITAFGPGEVVELELSATLATAYDLGTLRIRASPMGGGCVGDTEADTLLLSPQTATVFVPEVFTPDGNGQNDTWMITCLDGVDPAAYRLYLFNEGGGKELEMLGLHQNFDGGNLPDGVYWWVLQDAEGRDLQAGGVTIRRK